MAPEYLLVFPSSVKANKRKELSFEEKDAQNNNMGVLQYIM